LKKFAASCLIFFVLALSLTLNGALAQARTVGVSVGDTFKYTYTLEFNSTNSTDLTLPTMIDSLLEQARAIEWEKMTILSISGTNVTAQTQLHFENGTEKTGISTSDIAIGQGNLTQFLIASNLSQNDPIYTTNSGQDIQIINETIMRDYQSTDRQVNHQSIISDYNVTQEEAALLNLSSFQQHNTEDIFWDRQIGVLVEMSYNMVTQSPTFNANISLNLNLIESNRLVIPEFPTIAHIALVILASGAAIAIYKRKK
jgi:hypothetical protein